jgi:uncharacterized membrane protein
LKIGGSNLTQIGMESFVARTLSYLATLVDFSTGALIATGVLVSVVSAARIGWRSATRSLISTDSDMPQIRITLGRWLALALEFALAADVLRTVMVPTWGEIGKLAAIVVLRTVLNYFLAREIEQEQKKAEYVLHSAA